MSAMISPDESTSKKKKTIYELGFDIHAKFYFIPLSLKTTGYFFTNKECPWHVISINVEQFIVWFFVIL